MKGSFACSGRERLTKQAITTIIAACAIYRDFFTTVYRKKFKFDTAKGIYTPSQIVIIEIQRLCNAKDVHT
jgi:hypothetical protein